MPDCIALTISTVVALQRISEATGNVSMRISSPLSGRVSGQRFRITLPPGFNNPYRPILVGEVLDAAPGSRVEYELVRPWLGHAAMVTVLILFGSIAWPNTAGIGIAAVAVGFLTAVCLGIRKREASELVDRLKAALSGAV